MCLQVVVTFEAKQDRNDFYTACKEGLKRTSLVVTMDSKSRLAGRWALIGGEQDTILTSDWLAAGAGRRSRASSTSAASWSTTTPTPWPRTSTTRWSGCCDGNTCWCAVWPGQGTGPGHGAQLGSLLWMLHHIDWLGHLADTAAGPIHAR